MTRNQAKSSPELLEYAVKLFLSVRQVCVGLHVLQRGDGCAVLEVCVVVMGIGVSSEGLGVIRRLGIYN